MNFKIIISILLFLSTLVSCNEYRKILKTPGYEKKLTAGNIMMMKTILKQALF